MASQTLHHCLNCERPETMIPLLALRYDGKDAWICSQCIPILIHQPIQLAGKLRGAATIPPAPEDHA